MKKYNVVITPKAKKTAKTLFEYIADKNPFGAKKWIDAALKTISDLEFMPERGVSVEKYTNVRQIFFRSGSSGDVYRIIYLVQTERETVYILTVRHGSGTI